MGQILHYFKLNFFFYVFGRFYIVRLFYKRLKSIINLIIGQPVEGLEEEFINWNFEDEHIINDLNTKALFSGLQLKDNILNEFLQLSSKSKLWSRHEKREFQNYSEVERYNFQNEKPCCVLYLTDPKINDLANKIARDKNLLRIAKKQIGRVSKIDTLIQWSPVCKSNYEWRNKQQTIDFHYDSHGLNFLYIFFYFTSCNKETGAHEMIMGSHSKKNILKHLIGSAKNSRDSLEVFYGKDKFITLDGLPGFGFIEDTSCFHRANIPTKDSRLAVQLRYS